MAAEANKKCESVVTSWTTRSGLAIFSVGPQDPSNRSATVNVMGLKLSTNNQPRMRTYSASTPGSSGVAGSTEVVTRNGGQSSRSRARSLGNFQTSGNSGSLGIPGASGGTHRSSSPDSESSSPGDDTAVLFGGRPFTHSLPVHLFALQGTVIISYAL